MIKTKEAKDRARIKNREKMERRRKLFLSQGLCTYCGKTKVSNSRTCLKCRMYLKEIRLRDFSDGTCYRCSRNKKRENRLTCEECSKKTSERNKIQMVKTKKEVMNHYGGKCVCCSEGNIAFLTLDHVNNDGQKHRKITGSGCALYYFLKKNNFPTDFELRILCFNCNIVRKRGSCPHGNGI